MYNGLHIHNENVCKLVTDGELAGAGSAGTYGVGPRRDVAHPHPAASPLPCTGAFAPRPPSGTYIFH